MNTTLNRLHNIKNEHQGNAKRVLCVCSAGLLRSPTISWLLGNPPYNFNTRAVGSSQEYALIPIENVHVAWADEVICADEDQVPVVQDLLKELSEMYGKEITKPVHCLNIPDMYGTRSSKLIKLIEDKVSKIYKV